MILCTEVPFKNKLENLRHFTKLFLCHGPEKDTLSIFMLLWGQRNSLLFHFERTWLELELISPPPSCWLFSQSSWYRTVVQKIAGLVPPCHSQTLYPESKVVTFKYHFVFLFSLAFLSEQDLSQLSALIMGGPFSSLKTHKRTIPAILMAHCFLVA